MPARGVRRLSKRLCLSFLIVLATMGAAAAQSDPVGRVDDLRGRVMVMRQEVNPAGLLAIGAPIYERDVIRTDAGARVRLVFIDETVVQLGEETELTVTRFVYAPPEATRAAILGVPSGFVRAIVGLLLPRSGFEVHTATAVAAARSTDWIVEAGPDATAIVALDGTVAVSNIDPTVSGTVLLGPRDGTVVARGSPPATPNRWGAPRIGRSIDATAIP